MSRERKELWLDIPGSVNYQVSSFGRVRRSTPGRGTYVGKIVGSKADQDNYSYVVLDGQWNIGVHQVVMLVYRGPCPEGHVVNHKDGKKWNNRPHNLEYLTWAENNKHAMDTGLNSIERSLGKALKVNYETNFAAQKATIHLAVEGNRRKNFEGPKAALEKHRKIFTDEERREAAAVAHAKWKAEGYSKQRETIMKVNAARREGKL